VTADGLPVALGDRQAGSAVRQPDRNRHGTRHDARLASPVNPRRAFQGRLVKKTTASPGIEAVGQAID